jgi:hypothetical protein
MQICKARYLSANFIDAFVQVWIFQILAIIKFLPCLGNRGLLGDDPGVERAADLSQTVDRPKAPMASRPRFRVQVCQSHLLLGWGRYTDHPADPEAVGQHAEAGGPEGLAQRHLHLAAIG